MVRISPVAALVALVLLAAACTGTDTDEPSSSPSFTIVEEPRNLVEDAVGEEESQEVDPPKPAATMVARPMPLDGNRIYEGVADFSGEPTIVDGFDADGVLAWEGPEGIEWMSFNQSDPIEVWADDDKSWAWPIGQATGFPSTLGEVPDALPVFSGDLFAQLIGPTDRYPHGALGDNIEASGLSIGIEVETAGAGPTASGIQLPLDEADVVEGISPMLADLDDDGAVEVIVTVSNASGGARLVSYGSTDRFQGGSELVVAESDPIGQGNRWRHQIAVGPTGPNGETELVVVRTPHIGGNVEWFRLEGDRLELVGTFGPGNGGIRTTSHVLGTTNLDLAAIFDADGDGELELVIPVQDRTALAVIERTEDGGELEQLVEFPGEIATNLAVAERDDGTIAVAIGTTTGQVVIWD